MSGAMKDAEVYTKIWSDDPNYGTAPSDVVDTVDHRILPHMRRVFKDKPPVTVADFGAGDGRFLDLMKQRGMLIAGIGIDIVRPAVLPDWLTWHKQELWRPVNGPQADYVISTDALEHMRPETLKGCIYQIKFMAPHGFLRISLQEDAYGTARGLKLHPSLFSSHEWRQMLTTVGIEPTSFKVYLGKRRAEQALEVWF